MERRGNRCNEWSLFRCKGNIEEVDIQSCLFAGPVKLDITGISNVVVAGVSLRPGLFNSSITDCIVTFPCLVRDCPLIRNAVIQSDVAMMGCGVVGGGGSFGLGGKIAIAVETGQRSVACSPDLSIELAAKLSDDPIAAKSHAEHVESVYTERAIKYGFTIISSGCRIISCPKVVQSFLGTGCLIESSTIINSCLLGNASISTAVVMDSLLHASTLVSTFGIVDHSILMSNSSVANHGKLIHSILGEYSGVASGECVSSLLGPLVGFHHQSLLIAAHWPLGRGNIGYGANVGSNHTGKSADQEIRPGEGMFFGLGCIVKFPCNFEDSPYSLIASGVVMLPQRMSLPFALVNAPSESIPGLSPSLNEVIPAWLLSDSVFTLLRNESKFKARQGKNATLEWKVFRIDIFEKVVRARDELVGLSLAKYKTSVGEPVYTEKELPSLGKNYLRESVRVNAIQTYTDFIQWFSLQTLWERIKAFGAARVLVDLRRSDACNDRQWAFSLTHLPAGNVPALLKLFLELHDRLIVQGCLKGKERDNKRAESVIGNSYARVHPPPVRVEACATAIASAKALRAHIDQLLLSARF